MDKVVMIRTVGGEFIIGKEPPTIAENIDNKVHLTDARLFNIQPTGRGSVAIAFLPPFPFTKAPIKDLENITIDNSAIILKVDEKYIDQEIINGYNSNISGLDLSAASKPSIVI